jgi:hypothetical protein
MSNSNVPCPTEGWVLRDQELEPFYDAVARDIAAFMAADRAGNRREWINTFFAEKYPPDATDEAVVDDIRASHWQDFGLSIAECDQCGRLWVQRGTTVNEYRSYAPDEPGYAGALRAR